MDYREKTAETIELERQYFELFGIKPDTYEDVDYKRMTHAQYLSYLKIAVGYKRSIEDVVL